MPDYKKMYFELAAKVAGAIDDLIEAQRQGEESYITDELPNFHIAELSAEYGEASDCEEPCLFNADQPFLQVVGAFGQADTQASGTENG